MKMFRCLIAFFLLSSSLWAQTDTLFVYETRTPLLVDRSDNELFFLRIESKGKGNTFNQLKLRIGEEIRLSDIKAIKVYYAGTDAPERRRKQKESNQASEHFHFFSFIIWFRYSMAP